MLSNVLVFDTCERDEHYMMCIAGSVENEVFAHTYFNTKYLKRTKGMAVAYILCTF